MGDLMNKILADKLRARNRLAALPFDQKLTLMERMRDRSLLISANSLRTQWSPTVPVVLVSGGAAVLSAVGANIAGLTPPACCQSLGQLNTRQNSVTLIAELRKRPEHWLVERVEESEPEFASPSQASLDFHQHQQKKL